MYLNQNFKKTPALIFFGLSLFFCICALTSNSFADPQECAKNGCSIRECSMANQNGYSCKAWKCFKQCMSGKGFAGSCYKDHLTKLDQCKQANDTCESSCKYK